MSDYISREAALSFPFANGKYDHENANEHFIFGCETYKEWLEQLPAANVVEVIRCKDCRWWDKYGDYDNGYCMAAKHGYWSSNWEISIRRTYKGDFYCADAEPKEEQE